ncbi:unnamed protein product, partial [Polarella glacialis]
ALLALLLPFAILAEGVGNGPVGVESPVPPHKVSPAEQCAFALPPELPYYWEPSCAMGLLGCMADGVHLQCRFCGEAPFTGLPCPLDAVSPAGETCAFDNAPTTP